MTLARVYEFGLMAPTVNAELVEAQIRAAHRYRNVLVELERDRRRASREILSTHPDTEVLAVEVARLAAVREDLRGRMRGVNAAKRGRVPQPALRDAIRDVAGRLRTARAQLKTAKQQIATDVAVQAALKAVDARANERRREERGKCGTYWGTYNLQEAAADRARNERTPPRFRPFLGEGRVGVQLQGGIALDELWGSDTQIRIALREDLRTSRHARLRQRGVLKMRVQSDERGKPIWAEWPVILHRPLPEGCRIKSAVVHKRRCRASRSRAQGWDWTWTLTIQVELPDAWTGGTSGEGAVALNLGFTGAYDHLQGDLRAGYLVDEVGHTHEAAVPSSVISRVEKSESIRGFRDKNLDQLRGALVTWLRQHESELPTWFVDRTILSRRRATEHGGEGQTSPTAIAPTEPVRNWHVTHWRSADRFRALGRAWRDARWPNDEEGFAMIDAWRDRDAHLQQYESGLLRGALLARRERYRLLANDLSARYATLVIGTTDLRELQRSPAPEEERAELAHAKRNQRHAAGSVLRGCLINAFKRRGGRVEVVDDDKATSTCHACGSHETWDRIAERQHTCSACLASWDQDENHAKNLLARWRREQLHVAEDPEGARPAKLAEKKESRSERLRRTRWKSPVVATSRES